MKLEGKEITFDVFSEEVKGVEITLSINCDECHEPLVLLFQTAIVKIRVLDKDYK